MDQTEILVVGAHPDDVEFGMGGSLLQFAEAGHSITSLCLTQGEMGTYGDLDLRREEFNAACEFMGAQAVMLDMPDTGVENTRESRLVVSKIIRQVRPKIVFCPYHTNPVGELKGLPHVDHYTCGSLVRDALKFARLKNTDSQTEQHEIGRLYFYMLPKTLYPEILLDVSAQMDRYEKLLGCYRSQLNIRAGSRGVLQAALDRRSALGLAIGVDYAEGFVTEQPISTNASGLLTL